MSSADGLIHIWSLDGRGESHTPLNLRGGNEADKLVVQVLDRSKALPLRDPSGEFTDPSAPERTRDATESGHKNYTGSDRSHCTRDVSWHGYEPSLMST
jgi:WD repeat-containing protein 23